MKEESESESDRAPKDWSKVSTAARFVMNRDAGDDKAPFGFSTRVVAQWMAARREQAMLLWQRWSVRAAVCSVILVTAFVLVTRRGAMASGDDLLFSVPSFDVPVPSDSR